MKWQRILLIENEFVIALKIGAGENVFIRLPATPRLRHQCATMPLHRPWYGRSRGPARWPFASSQDLWWHNGWLWLTLACSSHWLIVRMSNPARSRCIERRTG